MAVGRKAPATDPNVAPTKNSLGLGHRELGLLSDLLDRAQGTSGRKHRVFARWPFRHVSVPVVVRHPGGTEATVVMASRNLSRGGVSLLHNAYVHPGSRCVVMLPVPDGPPAEAAGLVAFCAHRHSRLHEVGVKFDQPVSIRRHLNSAAGTELFVFERIDPNSLRGRLLVVEDSATDQKIVAHFLKETRLEVRFVRTVAEASAEPAGSFDLMLIDWTLPDGKGSEVFKKFREAGCRAPVCFMTADPAGLLSEGMWDPPNSGMLAKPFSAQQLLQTLAELSDGHDIGAPTPVRLDAASADRLRLEARQLDAAVRGGDVGAVLDRCLEIGSIAEKASLSKVSAAAENLVGLLAEGASASTSEKAMELVRLCDLELAARAA